METDEINEKVKWCEICDYTSDHFHHKGVCAVCAGITVWDENLLIPASEKQLVEKINHNIQVERIIYPKVGSEEIFVKSVNKHNSNIQVDTYVNKHDKKYKESYVRISSPAMK